ncbi:hypothetical protein HYDPIDRAFT_33939 [Hydnomerulius pinastri MD-312]|uniref:Uncharacterized protein n=1 Tax=Hydnomerulius pinastri MD-312 TaxID=994086 RepID=A0A0C9W772_9AGAM|nr:hypothetical protein HYDPIDRAFT_33939 [Hydnomerulius pinastri MD-312]
MPRLQDTEDFTSAINNAGSDNNAPSQHGSDSTQSDSKSDEDLQAIHAANATPEEVHQALNETQNILFEMHRKYHTMMKQDAFLDAHSRKGHKGKKNDLVLTDSALLLTLKEDEIHAFGRKYSMTHCLWVNAEIFPLTKDPKMDPHSSEHWLSPLSMEDGVKSDIFLYIPSDQHALMAHKTFGSHFSLGVQSVCSESISEVKICTGANFQLPSEYFTRGYPRDTQPECQALIMGPRSKYTKFAPVLFPHADNPKMDEFLKNSVLIKILRVSLFGKALISGTHAPGPRTKGQI